MRRALSATSSVPSPIPPTPWGTYGGVMGGTGPDAAAGVPGVLNAIWLIAETTASLPVEVWSGKLADKRLMDSSWQWKLLHDKPNEEQSPFDFWFDVTACIESRGNAYLHKVKYQGRVVALHVIDPDIVSVQRDRQGQRVYRLSGRDGDTRVHELGRAACARPDVQGRGRGVDAVAGRRERRDGLPGRVPA
jgi:hypothetical protein